MTEPKPKKSDGIDFDLIERANAQPTKVHVLKKPLPPVVKPKQK